MRELISCLPLLFCEAALEERESDHDDECDDGDSNNGDGDNDEREYGFEV